MNKVTEKEFYSTEDAKEKALVWCNENKGWKRICDIDNVETLYKNWNELSSEEKEPWISSYGEFGAESAWIELSDRPCKFEYGFITGKGEFYSNILQIPKFHNLMQVYKVG